MDWSKKKRSNTIGTWNFQQLEAKGEIDWLLSKHRYEEAQKRLNAFVYEETPEAKQYILYIKAMVRVQLKELDYEKALIVFEEALRLTLRRYGKIKLGKCILTRQEMTILNGIAIIYAKTGRKRQAVELYEELKQSYQESKIEVRFCSGMYAIILENLSIYLEELGNIEKSLEICKQGVKLDLECRKGNMLAKILTNIAYTMERHGMEKEACLQIYKQAYWIGDLMQDVVTKNIVRNYCENE